MFGSIGFTAFALVGAMILGGCGSHHGRSAAPGRVDLQFASLAASEEAHHSAAQRSTDGVSLREETRRYAADMDSLMGAMADACGEMMTGMMGGMMEHDADAMRAMMGSISDAVHMHHARMDSIETLEEMLTECEEHHGAMGKMLTDLEHAIGGMM